MSHRTHCCKKHGCKYNDDDCTVVLGTEKQAYRQECCDIADDIMLSAYRTVFYDMKEQKRDSISIEEIEALIRTDPRIYHEH